MAELKANGTMYAEIYPEIDLTDRKLGEELVKDARGQLPIDVWDKYLFESDGQRSEVCSWSLDPDDPEFAPIDPQQAVDKAEPLLSEVLDHLMSDSPLKALNPLSTSHGNTCTRFLALPARSRSGCEHAASGGSGVGNPKVQSPSREAERVNRWLGEVGRPAVPRKRQVSTKRSRRRRTT